MKTLLARILCSAAQSMWQMDPTLGKYTSETAEHELNLAFHLAAELRAWFAWLDCDFDVTKPNFNRDRPDIILHRRQTSLNFLVIEVKRKRFRDAVPADIRQIREKWFQGNLRYRFGAAVILDEDNRGVEVQVLSRVEKGRQPLVLKHSDMRAPLQRPNFARDRLKTLSKAVDRIVAATQRDTEVDASALEREIDQLVYALYGLTPEEIKIVEDSNRA